MKDIAKSKYIKSAATLIVASVVVKVISAFYKIPLTHYIGATGRGYFACAYNVFMPLHIITMGSLPIALSKLVSKYNYNDNKLMLNALKISANRIFFYVGLLSSLIVVAISVPYCQYIAKSPNSIYSVLAIAPAVMLSTMSGSYRGFFEGLMNMTPTSVSQTIDALIKAVFGILFARLSMVYFYNRFINKTSYLLKDFNTFEESLPIIYPYTTAFAVAGVSLGSLISYLYLVNYSKRHYPSECKVNSKYINKATSNLLSFSFSIMLGCAFQSIFQFLDSASIQLAISQLSTIQIRSILSDSLYYVNVRDEDLYTYLYGIYNSALDFKNIIPGITMAIGICAVPAISSAYESKSILKIGNVTNTIIKYTVMLSTFCGSFLAIESENILNSFYYANKDIAVGSAKLVALFGVTALSYSFAGSTIFCLQAIGKPKKSIPPFIVGGLFRIVLNVILVSTLQFNLYGGVISGFIGYSIIGVWNMIIFLKQTKCSLLLNKSILAPIFASIITAITYYFALSGIISEQNNIKMLILKSAIFIVIYLVWASIFNIFGIKELKTVIIYKKHR